MRRRSITRYTIWQRLLVNVLVKLQAGVCPVCGSPAIQYPTDPRASSGVRKQDYAVIDHCHRTHRVRGAVCLSCNLVISAFERGKLGASCREFAPRLAAYLKSPPAYALYR